MARNRKNRKAATATATVTATNNTPQTMTTTTAYTWNDLDNELNALLASWAEPELELTKPEEFAHLSSIELAQMCDHLGINSHGTHQQLCWRLADAENGTLSHTLLVANNPNPKVVLAPSSPRQSCQDEPKTEPTQASTYRGAYGHKPAHQYVPAPDTLVDGWDITRLSYRDLQGMCKNYGVPAKGTRENLEFALLTAVAGGATKCDPDAKKSTTKKATTKKSEPKVTEALTYRQAQRLNSWAKQNLSKYEAPTKNTGWQNVKLIAKELCNNKHFQALMQQRKQVELLAAELDCSKEQLRTYLAAVAA